MANLKLKRVSEIKNGSQKSSTCEQIVCPEFKFGISPTKLKRVSRQGRGNLETFFEIVTKSVLYFVFKS